MTYDLVEESRKAIAQWFTDHPEDMIALKLSICVRNSEFDPQARAVLEKVVEVIS